MPRVNITWYQPKVRRIMRDVRALRQKDIADIEVISQQAVSKKILNKAYESSLTNWIQILDLAGYEIREKEE